MAGKRAILIGVDGYSFQPLTSAVNDVVAVRAALIGDASGNAPPIVADADITTLATPASGATTPPGSGPATRDAIVRAFRAHYDAADPIDFLLVYFAGHGLSASPHGGPRETVILPSDVSGPEDGRNMISVTELIGLFAERGPLEQLWIIDACRDMPYEKRPRGFWLDWEVHAQGQRAQYAIFAVAPGGTALSAGGGQGRFTSHLVKGLGGGGCAVEPVPGRGHCVTAPSLYAYVRRRVAEALKGYDEFTKAVQLPQAYQSGSDLQPLRDLPPPLPREFRVTIEPPEAEAVVQVALEVQAGLPVAGWPPRAPPRIYELRAALQSGAEAQGWQQPKPALKAVDLREEDLAVIEVPRERVVRGGGAPESAATEVLAPTSNWGVTTAATSAQTFGEKTADNQKATTLRVEAEDRAVTISVRRAEPPWSTVPGKPNEPIPLARASGTSPFCWATRRSARRASFSARARAVCSLPSRRSRLRSQPCCRLDPARHHSLPCSHPRRLAPCRPPSCPRFCRCSLSSPSTARTSSCVNSAGLVFRALLRPAMHLSPSRWRSTDLAGWRAMLK
jgi:Caspase domain